MADKMLDPNKTICVVKNMDGKIVGRIAATATNAADYLDTMARFYGNCSVEYVEDPNAWLMAALRSPVRSSYY